jgi:NAD(P)H-flavin reductase/ferredoxin
MTYRIAVAHSDVVFDAEAGETVLDAAERAGFSLPYSCRKGVCSSCEAGLASGTLKIGSETVEGPQPAVLLCQGKPLSDVVIRPRRIERRNTAALRTIKARVFRIDRPAPDVVTLLLRFAVSVRAKFRAGQYLRILLPNGDTRNFSMANPPQESDGVRLHIRHIPGGLFSEQILASLKLDDELTIEIPHGDMSLRDDGGKPIVFIATSTGFAPVKSMIEDLINRNLSREVSFYWGGRRPTDLYMAELPQKWQARERWFRFVPVLSEPDPSWEGRTGHVHKAVAEDFPDLSSHQVYACGNPVMVKAARTAFVTSHQLPDEQFYADPFVASGNQPAQISGAECT